MAFVSIPMIQVPSESKYEIRLQPVSIACLDQLSISFKRFFQWYTLDEVEHDQNTVRHYPKSVEPSKHHSEYDSQSIPKQLKQYSFDFSRGVCTRRIIYYLSLALLATYFVKRHTHHFLDKKIVDKL